MAADMAVDMTAHVGPVALPNPVMTASGTAGHGAELGAYFDLSLLGAVVVKSLSWRPGPATRPPGCYPPAGACSTASGCKTPGSRRGWLPTCRLWLRLVPGWW